MSTDENTLDLAKAVKAVLDHRTTVSRLGKSIYREIDQDILAMREASRALSGLLGLSDEPRRGATFKDGVQLDPNRAEPPFPGSPSTPTDDEREALAVTPPASPKCCPRPYCESNPK